MDLVFDITIMSLLVVTIIYAWRLNGKLNTIRNHKAELKANIAEFYKATERATSAVKNLQKEGQTVCKNIDGKISKARLTADEMDFLIGRANRKMMEVEENKAQAPSPTHASTSSASGLDTSYDNLLDEVLNVPRFETQQAPRKPVAASQNLSSKFNSVNEAQLAKALRDKQYRDALVG